MQQKNLKEIIDSLNRTKDNLFKDFHEMNESIEKNKLLFLEKTDIFYEKCANIKKKKNIKYNKKSENDNKDPEDSQNKNDKEKKSVKFTYELRVFFTNNIKPYKNIK